MGSGPSDIRAHGLHAHPRRTYPKWSSWARRAAVPWPSSCKHLAVVPGLLGWISTENHGRLPRWASPPWAPLWRDGMLGVRGSGPSLPPKPVLCQQSRTLERSWPELQVPHWKAPSCPRSAPEAVRVITGPPGLTHRHLSLHALPTRVVRVHGAAAITSPWLLPRVGRAPPSLPGRGLLGKWAE